MNSDDRRLDVLRAIVEDYVATSEPVGSRALTERHHLGVSPATIRNDMAALEDAGYIVQPHTSAGRVPTDMGYRQFVDRLAEVKPLSLAERRAISTLLEEAVDLDDVIDRAVRLLAQLTQQVAVVQYPSLRRSALRHVELVPVGARHLLVVIITTTGRVEQRTLETSADLDEAVVAQLRVRLNVAAAGRRLAELDKHMREVERNAEHMTDAQLLAEAQAAQNELIAIFNEELVPAGSEGGGESSTTTSSSTSTTSPSSSTSSTSIRTTTTTSTPATTTTTQAA